jgi:hypothetical protein
MSVLYSPLTSYHAQASHTSNQGVRKGGLTLEVGNERGTKRQNVEV